MPCPLSSGLKLSFRGAALVLAWVSTAAAQPPDQVVRQALQANPVTAPYNLTTAYRNNQVVLAGTVGTKQVHDLAVRLAIATGYPIRDDLVIFTAAAHRVAAAQAQAQLQAQAAAAANASAAGYPVVQAPSLSAGTGTGGLPYIYPPPLFGRIDDPFFGFEPPLVSYPPWWRAVVARSQPTLANPGTTPAAAGTASLTSAPAGSVAPSEPVTIPLGTSPQDGMIEMSIDPRGCAVLRGMVPTMADRIAIGQKIAQTPGVTEVLNLLQVAVNMSPEMTPPPPQPQLQPLAQPQPQPAQPGQGQPGQGQPAANPQAQGQPAAAGAPSIVIDGGPLNERLTQAFARRPALAGLPIQVTVRDGAAVISGRVPTVYEAMLAFRLVEQTPGIQSVTDKLEFVVPDGERQNPLIKQGRPEDVEPYLTAQLKRNVGDAAHVDRVRVMGDTVEIKGTLVHEADRQRLDATIRSMPVLRGFRIESHFDAE